MLHYETIEPATLELLKELQQLPELKETRLVGGTALALQIGHRKSIDLDLFGNVECDSSELQTALASIREVTPLKLTTNINIFNVANVKVYIVNYKYPWIGDCIEEDTLRLASAKDIAAMKVTAVIGRGSIKDFTDIAHLLDYYTIDDILDFYQQKYHDGSLFMALKSLTYFVDAEGTPMPYMFSDMSWDDVKNKIITALQ